MRSTLPQCHHHQKDISGLQQCWRNQEDEQEESGEWKSKQQQGQRQRQSQGQRGRQQGQQKWKSQQEQQGGDMEKGLSGWSDKQSNYWLPCMRGMEDRQKMTHAHHLCQNQKNCYDLQLCWGTQNDEKEERGARTSTQQRGQSHRQQQGQRGRQQGQQKWKNQQENEQDDDMEKGISGWSNKQSNYWLPCMRGMEDCQTTMRPHHQCQHHPKNLWDLQQLWRNQQDEQKQSDDENTNQQQQKRQPAIPRGRQQGQQKWKNQQDEQKESDDENTSQQQQNRQPRGRQQGQQKWKNQQEEQQDEDMEKDVSSWSDKQSNYWTEKINLEGCRPDKVKAKWDSDLNALIITVPKMCQPWESRQGCEKKMKRVVRLPVDLNLTKLHVRMNMKDNELVMTAPYKSQMCGRPTHGQMQQCGTFSPNSMDDGMWMPLQQGKHMKCQNPMGMGGMMPTSCRGNRCSMQVDNCFCFMQQTQMLQKKMLKTKVVKDKQTGKWKLLIDVLVGGFRREEVKVNWEENEGVLVMEAKHEKQQQKKGVFVKQLREEIVVPEGCEGNEMRFQMKENGIVHIEVPCNRKPTGVDMGEESEEEEQGQSSEDDQQKEGSEMY